MPARDMFHDAVRTALDKEQWTITKAPFVFRIGQDSIYIDLAADNNDCRRKRRTQDCN